MAWATWTLAITCQILGEMRVAGAVYGIPTMYNPSRKPAPLNQGGGGSGGAAYYLNSLAISYPSSDSTGYRTQDTIPLRG